MKHYYTTPKIMIAKFDSTCPETGKPIKRGDTIAYFPDVKKAYHESSKNAEIARGIAFSEQWEMGDRNY